MSEDKHRPLGEIRLNRRTLLKGLAASTGLALLAACGSSDSGSG
ncbi:MAG: twin-arginine translocation signal domain-containing protein, partial [Chloroflexota bacterium]|nr:twin-arginine translocation signal domain-containing protein [Chloroflexota bacterium]